jgi:hypothetical protein
MKSIAKFLLFMVANALFIWFIWSPFVRSLRYEQLISIIMGLTGVLTAFLITYKPSLRFSYIHGYMRGLEKGQK